MMPTAGGNEPPIDDRQNVLKFLGNSSAFAFWILTMLEYRRFSLEQKLNTKANKRPICFPFIGNIGTNSETFDILLRA